MKQLAVDSLSMPPSLQQFRIERHDMAIDITCKQNYRMQFVERRQNDPQYLRSIIAQREIMVEEQERRCEQAKKEAGKLRQQLEGVCKQKTLADEAAQKQVLNLTLALAQLQSEMEIMRHENSELQFLLNNSKLKMQQSERQNTKELEMIKMDNDAQKSLHNIKIGNLQKNISDLKKYYRVEEGIMDDKKKIIEDSGRDLKGFSNDKPERMLIIQNQQYKNEIEYQSKHVTIQLEKNQQLTEKVKNLKVEIELHKSIQNDLVKRSSLAQALIKRLYKDIQSARASKPTSKPDQHPSLSQTPPEGSSESQRSSRLQHDSLKSQSETINKLKFEIANLKNYNHYLESMQKTYSRKYETLGSLMADYLENLLYSKQKSSDSELEWTGNEISINIYELKSKDMKEWKFEELQAVLTLLIAQIKPFLSKSSLIHFPVIKNINISFIDEAPKQVLSLPRIAEQYEQSCNPQPKPKGQHNRFKGIPIDISTKILRSNLRQWGSKVKYANLANKKIKSKSHAEDCQRTVL